LRFTNLGLGGTTRNGVVQPFLSAIKFDDIVIGQRNDGFVKSSPAKAGLCAQRLGVNRSSMCTATTKLQRNAADGFFRNHQIFQPRRNRLWQFGQIK